MTPALLVETGRALYGSDWRSPLADELGVHQRTVRRWAAGEFPIPDGVEAELRRLVELRAMDIKHLLQRLGAKRAA